MSSGIFNKYTGYHNRQSYRLRGYDYSRPGAYFITVCINDPQQRIFGDVIDGKMILKDAGKYAEKCWLDIPGHFPHAKIDEYIIMPNHIHGIVFIAEPVRVRANVVGANNHSPLPGIQTETQCGNGANMQANNHSPQHSPGNRIRGTSKTIGSMVRGFKIGVTKWFQASGPGTIVWQRNYYDHVIRDDKSLFHIRHYIRNNPANWAADSEHHLNDEIDRHTDEDFAI